MDKPGFVVTTIPTDELKAAVITNMSLAGASLVEAPDVSGLPPVPTDEYNLDGYDFPDGLDPEQTRIRTLTDEEWLF